MGPTSYGRTKCASYSEIEESILALMTEKPTLEKNIGHRNIASTDSYCQ